MSNLRYLTKSRFKLAIDCPTKLFYTNKEKEYKNEMADDDFLAMLAEGGYQVGELAKKRYSVGIDITEKNNELAEKETDELLKEENIVLFEPAIRVGSFFIRIDILVKKGDDYKLIEVKAKSYNSINPEIEGANGDIKSGMLPYLQDVAFQTWVLRQKIPNSNIKSFLMLPDKSKKAPIDGINQLFKIKKSKNNKSFEVIPNFAEDIDVKAISEQLLYELSVDGYVEQILNSPIKYPGGEDYLSDIVIKWADAYKEDYKIAPVIGAHCGSCQFKTSEKDDLKSGFIECWKESTGLSEKEIQQGTILDLWNSRKKTALIEKHTFKLSKVLKDDLGDFDSEADLEGLSRPQRQWLQVNGIPKDHPHDGFYLDDALVLNKMSEWEYPYHLIDFETSAVALPFYSDMHPYESVAFQFSHHIIEEDGFVRHANQYLNVEPGEFPNYEFARALKKALDNDNGSIFMWSNHENSILSAILKQLSEESNKPNDAEELAVFIKSIIKGGERAMIDLCKLAEKSYFHPDTKGSNSIKKVLPAILKSSKGLQEVYSKPIYGTSDGIPSLNFSNQTWLTIKDGKISDPYAILKEYAQDLLPEGVEDEEEGNTSIISAGGAATTAYARLQFEDLNQESRERIKSALLRYCELDTLAMVMVLQGWQEALSQ
jgi:hypothetical protein